MKNLYPDLYFKKIDEITIDVILKYKIKLLILDVDNTLIDYYRKLPDNIKIWAKSMKSQGVKLYILSNTNSKKKVKKVAETLEAPYKYFAMKPLKKGFKDIQKEMNIPPENIAVVGDQIFTDVWGGNRCKMTTILVEPIDTKKEYLNTSWIRPLENKIKKKMNAGKNDFVK